ncbi:MAG: flagellar GTP-binding protein [Opitutaceae bacterium]|nr:flagellar GTP-binding protein [Opitutaceae bacterium]
MTTASNPALAVPGACYRFVVGSATEAAQLIRDQLGADARVLSVRTAEQAGWRRWFGGARLEVVAQVPAPAPADDEPRDAAPVRTAPAAPAGAAVPPAERDGSVRPGSFGRPASIRLPDLLRRSGFSEGFLSRLGPTSRWNDLADRPLHQSLVQMADELRRQATSRPPRPLPPRAAFFGPAGAGRTTALCKWLAAEVFRRERHGRVVKVEFDRPNPTEPLAVFCEALGVPYEHHSPPLIAPEASGFLYLDLPALTLRRTADNTALARLLQEERIEGRVLVLNAAYESATLRDAYAAGRDLGATHLVLTHLDELAQWGRLWDYLLNGGLEPLFLATGPSLTGDCEEDVHGAILRRTLPGA